MEKDIIKELLKFIDENCRQKHYYCEDSWYNCPKTPEGCADILAGIECNCGADLKNKKIDLLLSKYSNYIL